jgi:RNA polymerase sigma-70 factor (ECF subfamily)
MALAVEPHGEERQAVSDGFEALFRAQYATVVGIAQRVLADAHEAEDVAQEVFASYYRKHDPCAPYAAAWLHAAAVHTALNAVRGRRRRALREAEQGIVHARWQASAELAQDPQRAAEQEEQRREVRTALNRLPARSAAILVLRHSGLSYAEVAAAMGTSVGQVGTLLRRAEAALAREMPRDRR